MSKIKEKNNRTFESNNLTLDILSYFLRNMVLFEF